MKKPSCQPHAYTKVGSPYRPIIGDKIVKSKEWCGDKIRTVKRKQEVRGDLTQKFFCVKCADERQVIAGAKR